MPTTLRNLDILFNDGSTQSTAAVGASTTFGAVGTYAVLMNAANADITIGNTVAGSSLRYSESTNANIAGGATATISALIGARTRDNNSTYDGGGTSVSGTWRKMSSGSVYVAVGISCGGGTQYIWNRALYVRIS